MVIKGAKLFDGVRSVSAALLGLMMGTVVMLFTLVLC